MRMKRLAAACLALILLFLAGCGFPPPPEVEPAGTETEEPTPAVTAEPAASPAPDPVSESDPEPTPDPTPEPTADPTPEPTLDPAEVIALNTDELVFEHKGEKAEIYAGQADLSKVSWVTEDPSVAIVSQGTVMSIGPGETTIRAIYGKQEVSCRVLCTAPEDEYASLDQELMHAPVLTPPYFSEEDDALARSFFDDAVILGDSVTYVFWQWETKMDWLGDVTFLVRGGISLESSVTGRWKIYYQGQQTSFAEAIAASGAKKAFILMGINDLPRFGFDGTLDYYKKFVDQILEKSPDLEIYIESITPIWTPSENKIGTNADVDEFNELLRGYAEENGFYYVDLAPYLKDYTNGLARRYSSDELTHFTCDGCYAWAQVLKQVALDRLHEEE